MIILGLFLLLLIILGLYVLGQVPDKICKPDIKKERFIEIRDLMYNHSLKLFDKTNLLDELTAYPATNCDMLDAMVYGLSLISTKTGRIDPKKIYKEK